MSAVKRKTVPSVTTRQSETPFLGLNHWQGIACIKNNPLHEGLRCSARVSTVFRRSSKGQLTLAIKLGDAMWIALSMSVDELRALGTPPAATKPKAKPRKKAVKK